MLLHHPSANLNKESGVIADYRHSRKLERFTTANERISCATSSKKHKYLVLFHFTSSSHQFLSITLTVWRLSHMIENETNRWFLVESCSIDLSGTQLPDSNWRQLRPASFSSSTVWLLSRNRRWLIDQFRSMTLRIE